MRLKNGSEMKKVWWHAVNILEPGRYSLPYGHRQFSFYEARANTQSSNHIPARREQFHSSPVLRARTAFVKIVFNNEDQRLAVNIKFSKTISFMFRN